MGTMWLLRKLWDGIGHWNIDKKRPHYYISLFVHISNIYSRTRPFLTIFAVWRKNDPIYIILNVLYNESSLDLKIVVFFIICQICSYFSYVLMIYSLLSYFFSCIYSSQPRCTRWSLPRLNASWTALLYVRLLLSAF